MFSRLGPDLELHNQKTRPHNAFRRTPRNSIPHTQPSQKNPRGNPQDPFLGILPGRFHSRFVPLPSRPSLSTTNTPLALGFTNGTLRILSSTTLTDLPQHTPANKPNLPGYVIAKSPITRIAFSQHGDWMAVADEGYGVGVLRFGSVFGKGEEWGFVGRCRAHYGEVVGKFWCRLNNNKSKFGTNWGLFRIVFCPPTTRPNTPPSSLHLPRPASHRIRSPKLEYTIRCAHQGASSVQLPCHSPTNHPNSPKPASNKSTTPSPQRSTPPHLSAAPTTPPNTTS